MKKQSAFNFRIVSLLLVCFVLITAVALASTGCQQTTDTSSSSSSVSSTVVSDVTSDVSEEQGTPFTVIVVDADGNETKFEYKSEEKTVGAALLAKGLIEGDNGQYGLYVKKVNGITADYDKDHTYWAFYVGGEYATKGVDQTEIVSSETYTFKITKG